MKKENQIYIKAAGILVLGILLGWIIFGGGNGQSSETRDHDHTEVQDQIWTCSMHPQIRQGEPGDCPICGMDLIPLEAGETSGDAMGYMMSENAMKLANVETMIVGNKNVEREIRLNGKVQIDERNAYSQSTHIPGRIEQLSINFTGERISRGQTLATIYSPEMVTAQQELLQAARIRESQPELYQASREKLRNWRIGEATIDQIVANNAPIERFPIRADVSGVVTEKMVNLGDYVERGMPIYEIADLSKVWVLFDLYERELSAVNVGDKIGFRVNSLPGETFEGTIDFIDPLISSQTRVATARVEIENKDGRLKPEMFASGVISTTPSEAGSQEIVVPKTAVLWTGERSVVYVKETVNDNAHFSMREVTLGSPLGNSYVVLEGLQAGEEIVTNGTFTIDAAVQLSGGRSMMNPDLNESNAADNNLHVEVTEEAKADLDLVVTSYLKLKDALVADNPSSAKKEARELGETIEQVQNSEFDQDGLVAWESFKKEIKADANKIAGAENISAMRDRFDELSDSMIGMVKTFRLMEEGTLYVQQCPMADNDRGAEWLSLSSEIRNPYFGDAMLTCGEVREVIE